MQKEVTKKNNQPDSICHTSGVCNGRNNFVCSHLLCLAGLGSDTCDAWQLGFVFHYVARKNVIALILIGFSDAAEEKGTMHSVMQDTVPTTSKHKEKFMLID